jgi:hypothetical protein
MSQAREPEDRGREIDRELISMNRRLTRLEDSQVTGRELKESFGRVYDDIDDLELYMGQRFDVMEQKFSGLEQRFDRLEIEVRELRVDLGGKMDAILRQITGMNS